MKTPTWREYAADATSYREGVDIQEAEAVWRRAFEELANEWAAGEVTPDDAFARAWQEVHGHDR